MHNNQYFIIIRMYTHTETHTDYVQLTITVNLKFFFTSWNYYIVTALVAYLSQKVIYFFFFSHFILFSKIPNL